MGGLRRSAYWSSSVALALLVLRNSRLLGLLRNQSQVASALIASLGGLLSGSCCLLQLVLNYFSIGCAGFANLDQGRPFFLVATFGALAGRAVFERRAGISMPRPGSWAAAIVLAFLPEFLFLHNTRKHGKTGARSEGGELNGLNGAAAFETTLTASVSGVKCEACATGLRSALHAAAAAAEVDVLGECKASSGITSIVVCRDSVERTMVTIKTTTTTTAAAASSMAVQEGSGAVRDGVEGRVAAVPALAERGRSFPVTSGDRVATKMAAAEAVLDAACRKRSYTYSEVTSATRPTSLPRRV
jgi:hypothetical protein